MRVTPKSHISRTDAPFLSPRAEPEVDRCLALCRHGMIWVCLTEYPKVAFDMSISGLNRMPVGETPVVIGVVLLFLLECSV